MARGGGFAPRGPVLDLHSADDLGSSASRGRGFEPVLQFKGWLAGDRGRHCPSNHGPQLGRIAWSDGEIIIVDPYILNRKGHS